MIVDTRGVICYYRDAESNRNPRRFVFIAAGFPQSNIVGKAPFMCGLTSSAVRLSIGSAHEGRFGLR